MTAKQVSWVIQVLSLYLWFEGHQLISQFLHRSHGINTIIQLCLKILISFSERLIKQLVQKIIMEIKIRTSLLTTLTCENLNNTIPSNYKMHI
jgi:hypothetical protein